MPANLYKSGTTDAADGTLVTSGTKFAFTAVDSVLDLHLRCADDTYSDDAVVNLPSDGSVQISFDGGSTWKAYADNPIPIATGVGIGGTDLGDLNFPVKLRQHASTASVSGQLSTDGTFTACTALTPNPVAGFTVTPGNAQNAVSWTAVTNRTRYQVDRSTSNASPTAPNGTGGWSSVYTGTGTSFTDSGLTNGTTYYYRMKAVGAYRYSDTASFATANGAPVAPSVKTAVLALSPLVYYEFSETSGTAIADQGSLNVAATTQGSPTLAQTGPKSVDKAILFAGAQGVKADAASDTLNFGTGSFTVAMWVKLTSASATTRFMSYLWQTTDYRGWDYEYLSSGNIYRFRGLGSTPPYYYDNQFSQSFTAGTWYHIAFVCNGTNIKYYRDGTLADTWTPAALTMAAVTDSARRLIIGGTDLGLACNAAIAHPCIFNSALTQPQIQTMVDGA